MSQGKTIFNFKDYKAYLTSELGKRGERKGRRSALAKYIACQPAYISQVLNGSTDFNLEQSERVSQFLGHTLEERHYLLLLVQKERAGTVTLKAYFSDQIKEVQEKRMVLTDRLGKRTVLSKEHQGRYYSSWLYATVHMALTIPELQTKESLSAYLNTPMAQISEVLDFLLECGLATLEKNKYQSSQSNIRIGRDSYNLLKHHSNWRTQALISLEAEALTDLHYSSVFSVAKEDLVKIKDIFLSAIQKNAELVQKSKEESLHAICIDFFSMKK